MDQQQSNSIIFALKETKKPHELYLVIKEYIRRQSETWIVNQKLFLLANDWLQKLLQMNSFSYCPIDNSSLLSREQDFYFLKEGLLEDVDFFLIEEQLWDALEEK